MKKHIIALSEEYAARILAQHFRESFKLPPKEANNHALEMSARLMAASTEAPDVVVRTICSECGKEGTANRVLDDYELSLRNWARISRRDE
jgi:hypothetical protein